jgi:hypothetical protein
LTCIDSIENPLGNSYHALKFTNWMRNQILNIGSNSETLIKTESIDEIENIENNEIEMDDYLRNNLINNKKEKEREKDKDSKEVTKNNNKFSYQNTNQSQQINQFLF